jgi:hypothetical protein
VVYFAYGWLSTFKSDSIFHELRAHIAGGGEAATEILGVIPGETAADPTTWVSAQYSDLDVTYELTRVPTYGDEPLEHLLAVSANHCIP